MADGRQIGPGDSSSRVADERNFPGIARPGGRSADNTEGNVVKIFQMALASALTAAAARSGRGR